jgi:two-component system chemotaxis sensor kinase CheA
MYSEEELADLLEDFTERIDSVEQDLLQLESNPSSEVLSSLFRNLHTIKGAAGFIALHRFEKLSHLGENLLNEMRENNIQITSELIDLLLKLVTALREILEHYSRDRSEGTNDYEQLIASLGAVMERDNSNIPTPVIPESPSVSQTDLKLTLDQMDWDGDVDSLQQSLLALLEQ